MAEIAGLHKVKYISDRGIAHVYIDGEKVERVRSFKLEHDAGCVPIAKIERIALESEIECDAVVEETYGRARIDVKQGLGVYVNGVYVEGVDSIGKEGDMVTLRIKDPVLLFNGEESVNTDKY